MPLEVPNLDDRRWTDLVEEARSLIPRVAPRWTDHNVHDPGITFIELFAWLAEMQIYQLNRIGERHREAFGRLAGVERNRRTPSRVNVVVAGDLNTSVFIPSGTQVTPLEGDEIVFETTTDLILTRSRLRRLIVDDGSGAVDQTEANEKFGVAYLAFGEETRAGAELRLGFDGLYPGDEQALRLTADVFTSDLVGRCGPAVPIPVADAGRRSGGGENDASVQVAWEFIGAGAKWLPLQLISDETAALSRSGAVTLSVPSQAVRDRNHFWIRCRIVRGYYDIEPRLRHIGVNVLACAQQETVVNELLGRGNGRPDQSFELTKGPIAIPEAEPAAAIEVANELWRPVPSFDDSLPDSNHYVFDAESGQVQFGNGLNGRIPMPGQDVRARRYQTSAGRSGNVAKGLHWRFRTLVVPGVTMTNIEPASGGADPEPLSELELRARAQLSRPHRAVTLRDIEGLALGTPDAYVARAYAIANCPTLGRITVVALPKVRPGRQGPPRPPSGRFLDTVQRHLQQRRLLCDDLRVVGPIYVEVRVSARVRLTRGAGPAAVAARANEALNRFLAGDDQGTSTEQSPGVGSTQTPCPTRWPFGRSVFPSEVYAVLDRVAGVDAISSLTLTAVSRGKTVEPDSTGAIPISRVGLVYAGAHTVGVESGAERRP
jgi:predicted phage baseplate assembly protein